MKLPLFAMTVLLVGTLTASAQKAKPVLKVGKDGLPSGRSSPEGAVCDLARAFIRHDPKLLKAVCLPPRSSESGEPYADFLKSTIQRFAAEAKRSTPSPESPKRIKQVFAAQHLSKNGPASYGYAVCGFREVLFVDLSMDLWNGQVGQGRTLVVQRENGDWYAHPFPSAEPLLSAGLWEEKHPNKTLADVYRLRK